LSSITREILDRDDFLRESVFGSDAGERKRPTPDLDAGERKRDNSVPKMKSEGQQHAGTLEKKE
jgi:hypothetical protein